ncbi:uncharacterized protein, partial [Dermacentor albipictus]|uniref:uncharacterized protein n=1 Tax=Dermacentor albipictus TaxID=60249 RepID=UPI0038FD2C91
KQHFTAKTERSCWISKSRGAIPATPLAVSARRGHSLSALPATRSSVDAFPGLQAFFLLLVSVDPVKKRDFRARKFRSRHKFKGTRCKVKRRATETSAATKPNVGDSDAFDGSEPAGHSRFVDSVDEFVSASEKKLRIFENQGGSGEETASTFICEIGVVNTLVSAAACPACGRRDLFVRESTKKRKGLASFLELCCNNAACSASVILSTYSSRRAFPADDANGAARPSASPRESFAVNVKAVVAARAIGVGHNQLVRFCAILGLPKPMHHKSFTAITKKVHLAATKAVADNLELARNATAQEVGSANLAVMFDGTWQKRGHKSHNGIGTAISVETGLCLDFEVLSNYCQSCSTRKPFESEEEEEIWQAFHMPVCEKNADCSAHAMETNAALRIWKRTESYTTPLRFTTFLSDGDSKAYTAVSVAKVYGSAPITKEDCTNHVAKRLGTALRKLKMPQGQKLTDAVIQKLQSYFQVAITANRGSVRGMYCAIWASFFHSCSTDTAKSHKFCPEGEDSWCKFKRAEALGQAAPTHTPILTKSQGETMLPVYKRLTEEQLLTRCVKGKTQNGAESLNSKIWLLCPKTRFASRTVVEMATALAVLWYNQGHKSYEQVLQELGVLPSRELVALSKDCDRRRISSMSMKLTAEARSHRRHLAKKARLEHGSYKDSEGPTYGPGEF